MALRTEGDGPGGARGGRWALALLAAVVAAGVFWLAADAHLRRACTVMDTPYLPLCPDAAPDAAALASQLRERIGANPGDAWAWTRLLVAGEGPPPEAVIRAATVVAPNHPNVLRWRAAQAFERGQYAEGVDVLVQMVTARGSGHAAQVLARLAGSPEGQALLRPHLDRADRWLPSVLGHMSTLKLPPGTALPLVAEALEKRSLPAGTRQAYMRSLKSGGHWLDAYGLWLAHHRQAVPLLYNASFDQPLEQDGFDWEFIPVARSRAGVVLAQAAVARRGLVLDLEFTGRSFVTPILRQYVFAPPGAYRLAGEYMSKVRSESGLTWTVACTAGAKAVAGRSGALAPTGGLWKTFQVEFTIPADCGAVASVQLEPTAAYEAAVGMRGQLAFDAFSLVRTTP